MPLSERSGLIVIIVVTGSSVTVVVVVCLLVVFSEVCTEVLAVLSDAVTAAVVFVVCVCDVVYVVCEVADEVCEAVLFAAEEAVAVLAVDRLSEVVAVLAEVSAAVVVTFSVTTGTSGILGVCLRVCRPSTPAIQQQAKTGAVRFNMSIRLSFFLRYSSRLERTL